MRMVDGDGIGRRIATYRRRRGLSQAAWLVRSVAQNLGFRKSNVEFVLLTECHCCWISLACYTSRSIRLIGRPWQLAPNGNTIAGGLSDVRAVLTSYNSLLARPSVQVSDLTELRSKVAEVHRTYQAARYDDVVTALPGVLAAVEGFPGRKNGERREPYSPTSPPTRWPQSW